MVVNDQAGMGSVRGELANLSLLEMMTLIVFGAAALSSTLLAVKGWRHQLGEWLLTRHVLVDPAVLALPGLSGAGLDIPRAFIAAGLLGLVITGVVAGLLARARASRRTVSGR